MDSQESSCGFSPEGQGEFRFFLLGSPRIERASRQVAILRRQVRALLYYLSESLQTTSRDQLCYLLWPDLEQRLALRNVSHCLTHIRLALGSGEALIARSEEVALNAGCVWSDTAALGRRETETSFQRAERTVSLYRGNFLEGFDALASEPFNSWLSHKRRAWEQQYLDALAVIVEERRRRGDYPVAIRFARQYIETDELCEAMHYSLMELYASVGDRVAGLRQYESCAAALKKELGMDPTPKTIALKRRLIAGRAATAGSSL